jgi:asparagine synthase (glutamine-hydrolysing)
MCGICGFVSAEVTWRPKASFGAVPVHAALAKNVRPLVDDVLSPAGVMARGLFDPAEVHRLLRADEEGTEDDALRIWELLTLELWRKTFLDRAPAPVASVA